MSQGRVDGSVLITAKIERSDFKKGLDAMGREADAFSRSAVDGFSSVSNATDSMSGSLKGAAKAAAGLVAAYTGIKAVFSSLDAGVAANASLQDAAISIAAVLDSTHQLADAQGQLLEGQDSFNAALQVSKTIAKQVDLATKTTVASEIQLLQAVQATLAASSQQGASSQQTIKFLSDLGNAMSTFQLDLNNLSREAYTLLSGKNLGQSQLFQRIKNLGVSEEDIRSWIKAGTLIENVTRRLESFSAAGEAMAVAYNGASRDLTSSLAGIEEVVTKDLTGSLTEAKTALSELLYDPDTYELTESIKPLVDLAQDLASAFGEGMLSTTKSFVSFLESLSDVIDRNRDSIDLFGSGIKTVADNAGVIAVAIGTTAAAQRLANTEAGKYVSLLRQQSMGQAVILDGVKATKLRTAADREAAQAALALATVRLETAKKEYQLYENMGHSNVLTEQQASAWTRVVKAEKDLSAANVRVTQTTNAVAEAQKKGTLRARAATVATNALAAAGNKAKAGFTGLVNLMGGPWIAGITALSTAITFLATRQTEGEKAAAKYGKSLSQVWNDIATLEQKTDEAAKKQEQLTEARRKANEALVSERQKSIESLRKELDQLGQLSRTEYDVATQFTVEASFNTDEVKEVYAIYKQLFAEFQKTGDAEAFALGLKDLNDTLESLKKTDTSWFGRLRGEAKQTSDFFGQVGTYLTQYIKLNEEAGTTTTEYTAKAKSAAEATDELSKAFQEVNDNQKLDTAEGAIKFLTALTKESKEAKEASLALRKEQAAQAVETLKASASANEYAAALAQVEAHEARLANNNDLANALIARSEMLRKSAKEALLLAAQGESALKDPNFGKTRSTRSTRSAADTILDIERSIKELNTVSKNNFAGNLQKELDGIAQKGKEAGLQLATIADMQKRFGESYAANFLRDVNREMLELSGRGHENTLADIAAKAQDFSNALQQVGISAEEAKRQTDEYQRLLEKKQNLENLQEQLAFLKEVGELSGEYGLAIEIQNRLIKEQAADYRELFKNKPEMLEMVAIWERLATMEASRDYGDGWTRSARKFAEEWTNAASVAESHFNLLTGSISNIADAAIDSIFDNAEFRADQLFKDIAKQITKMLLNQAIGSIFGSLFGGSGKIGVPESSPSFVGPPRPSGMSVPSSSRSLNPVATPDASSIRLTPDAGVALQRAYSLAGYSTSRAVASGLGRAAPYAATTGATATQPIVNISVKNETSAQVGFEQSMGSNGEVQIEQLITSSVNRNMARGSFDGAMFSRLDRANKTGFKV